MTISNPDAVWIIKYNTWGVRVQHNSHVSVVKYSINEEVITETIENEELLEWGEAVNDHE